MNAKTLAKWAGRIIGMVACCFFLAFVVGEGLGTSLKSVDGELFRFLPMLGLAVLGFVLGLFRPGLGGSMAILGGGLMLVFHFYHGDVFAGLAYGAPFVFSGVLLIASIPNKKDSSGFVTKQNQNGNKYA